MQNPGAPRTADVGPYIADQNNISDPHNKESHWHAALGVYACGSWVGDLGNGTWSWPVQSQNEPLGRAADPNAYAGLHSHEDGIIHMEPATADEAGANATLGKYFEFGGWKVSATGFDFDHTTLRDGDRCGTAPGELHWYVNGKEHAGNPADYKLYDNDVIVLSFQPAGAPYPGDPPSVRNLPSRSTSGQVTSEELSAGGKVNGTLKITVAPGGDLVFVPNQLTARTGIYRITLNAASAGHLFEVNDAGRILARAPLDKAGQRVSIRVFFPHAGNYGFSCLIPGHAQAGMTGTLTVTGGLKTLQQALATAR